MRNHVKTFGRRIKRKTSHLWRHSPLGRGARLFVQAPVRGSKVSLALSRRVTWTEFIKSYEHFTDVLCVSAKEGCSDRREREYQALRKWFMLRYAGVAQRLRPYLSQLAADSTTVRTVASRRPLHGTLDGLEILFYRKTMKEILDSDAGDLISYVSRLSEAIYLCDSDLSGHTQGL